MWKLAWQRFRRSKLAVIALIYVALVTAIAAAAPLIAERGRAVPFAPDDVDFASRMQAPDARHPLGTDDLGRDVLARMIHGARVTLTVGFFATVSLVSLWLERYLLVMPSITPLPGPVFELPEAGPTLLFVGLYLLTYALFARTFPMISPRLAEITLERERGHASALVSAEFDHEESSRDYVSPESIERRGRPRG